MSEMNVTLGKIVMVDALKKNGVIQSDDDGELVFFQLNDMEMGFPKEGGMVQFMKDTSSKNATAKKIVVLADAASKAFKK